MPSPERAGCRIRLPARIDSVASAQAFMRDAMSGIGATDTQAKELDLVLEEIVANICRHAFPADCCGEFEVRYEQLPAGRLAVALEDDGVPFDPTGVPAPDLQASLDDRPVGGLGIVLVRSIVRNLSYHRRADRNVLSFEFPGS